MMPMGPPPGDRNEELREPKPKSVKEVPSYIKRVCGKFFYRLSYIFRLVWETKKWITPVMFIISAAEGVIPVMQTYIGTRLLVNRLSDAYSHSLTGIGVPVTGADIAGLLGLLFGCLIFNSIIGNIKVIVARISGELVANHVQVKLMTKAKTVDASSFDNPDFYQKLENASREAGDRPIQILRSTFSVISTVITIITYVITLHSVNKWASLIIIIISVPSAIISFIYRRKNFFYVRRRSKDRRQLRYYSDLMTDKDMMKEVRVFGLSDLFIDRYKQIFAKYFKGLRKIFIGEGGWNTGIAVVSALTNCVLLYTVASKIIAGEQGIAVGDYTYFASAVAAVAAAVTSFISTTASIYEGTLFIDNVIEFMAEKQTVACISEKPATLSRHKPHTIELRNVSFRYPGTNRDVIKNISVVIKPGETVVLVGLNGAGKTTLIKLITRLYDPTQGNIFLDGHDIREYSPEEVYKIFGIIFQDFGRYAVDVRENVMFGDVYSPTDEEKIRYSCRQSNSDSFISTLPRGYDTPLMRYFEPDGIELSTGQWQKLAIARAFYSDSDILILDEPTASLDAIAEQEIFNEFDELRKDKTTVFVSHRLSSAVTADKILVLEQGELIEQGNHAQLMALNGKYAKLFSTQAKRYIESQNAESQKAESVQ